MAKVLRESLSTRASSSSARMAYSTTEGPHRKRVRPFMYLDRKARKLLMLQSPCVCRRSSARAPLPYRLPLARPSPARSHSSPPTSADLRHYRRLTRRWNILRRVKHCGAHHGRFHSPRRFWTARVRRKGAGAHGTSPNGLTGESASADRRAGVVTKKHFFGQMLMLCA